MSGWFSAASYLIGFSLIGWSIWASPSLREHIAGLWARTGVEPTPEVVVGGLLFFVLSVLLGMVIGLGLLDHWDPARDYLSARTRFEGVPGFYWDNLFHPLASKALLGGVGAAAVLLGIAALGLKFQPEKLYGNDKWASASDLRKQGLFNNKGVIIGRSGRQLLRSGPEEHVLVEAATGGGKGVGVVIPNLLSWTGGAFVIDMKRENWLKTAGWRHSVLGQPCFCFNPVDPAGRTARFNPLGHIDRSDEAQVINELQKIAIKFYPEPASSDPFWNNSAQAGFIGIGAYIAANPALPLTIGEIYRLASRKSQAFFAKLSSDGGTDDVRLSEGAITKLADFSKGSANTYGGIVKTLTSKLGLWALDYVDWATSSSDFDLRTIRKKPFSLYMAAGLDDLERLEPLYNVMVQQLIGQNSFDELGHNGHNAPCLVMLDEFAQLGQMNILIKAFGLIRSYGFRLVAIIQDRAQLEGIYGRHFAKTMINNCGAEVVFAVKDQETAARLETRIGYFTTSKRSHSRRHGEFFGSTSVSEAPRALMRAQDILSEDRRNCLIFRAGMPAARVRKVTWFNDPRFMKKEKPAPEIPTREERAAGEGGDVGHNRMAAPVSIKAASLEATLPTPVDFEAPPSELMSERAGTESLDDQDVSDRRAQEQHPDDGDAGWAGI